MSTIAQEGVGAAAEFAVDGAGDGEDLAALIGGDIGGDEGAAALGGFGDDDAEPLLGVTALESVGIEVDPQNQRLKRLPTVRLKSATGRPADRRG